MTATQGKVHGFLGMKITYHRNGTAEIDTSEYIKESIENTAQPCVISLRSTPRAHDLAMNGTKSSTASPPNYYTYRTVDARKHNYRLLSYAPECPAVQNRTGRSYGES